MAAPHVSGALALVEQAFGWMTASQLADTVLSTAQKPQSDALDILPFNPHQAGSDANHPNEDFKWQVGSGQRFSIADPKFSPKPQQYECHVAQEGAVLLFWGEAGTSSENLAKLKEQAAERIGAAWIESKLEDAFLELDPEAYENAVRRAFDEWKTYFVDHCIVVAYALGAGLLDAGKAVGGLSKLNVNHMVRWDSAADRWTLPLNETGLSSERQLAYTLTLAGDGVSRFTNDIVEVDWNPVQHVTTEEQFNDYNAALESEKPYTGSDIQTQKPENADLPVSLVVSSTVNDKNEIATSGTLLFSGHAFYRGSTDVINGAVLVVTESLTVRFTPIHFPPSPERSAASFQAEHFFRKTISTSRRVWDR